MLFDAPGVVRRKVELYSELLSGRVQSDQVLQALGGVERYGVTDGQLYSIRSYADRKKDFVSLKRLGSTGDPGLRIVGVT